MKLTPDGRHLIDQQGRVRVLHGINLVLKGVPGAPVFDTSQPHWDTEDLAGLRRLGLNAVRLGINWAGVEPEPGAYDETYLAWYAAQIDACAAAGLSVIIDAHQDLYSQRWCNGAPDWATLTEQAFDSTELWSDAYLASPAVHEAYDAFWANAPGPGGVGLQDRFAAMWGEVAKRFSAHPAMLGYDLLNEPTPGAASAQMFGGLVYAFAEATGSDPEQVIADFADPEKKFAALQALDDVEVHRALGDALAPMSAQFEGTAVGPMMAKVAAQIRAHDSSGLILREHNYFGNIGVPSGVQPLDDPAWVYSPHGYDLTVDTPAHTLASDIRVSTIFARVAETADRLEVPVLVGEWGAAGDLVGVSGHTKFQLDLFDQYGWGWFYWCWTPTFASSEAAACLRRPRPVAIADPQATWGADGSDWVARWTASDQGSEFWVPSELQVRHLIDDVESPVQRDGDSVTVAPQAGVHEIRVLNVWPAAD